MQKRTHAGLRTFSGFLMATSAWIALAVAAHAMDTSSTPGVITGTSTTSSSGTLSGATIDSATLTQMSTDIGLIRGSSSAIQNFAGLYLPSIDKHSGAIETSTGSIDTNVIKIKDNIGDRLLDVQEAIVRESGDPCVPGDVTYSQPTNTVINLLSQIVNILKGPTATGSCTAKSAALADEMGMAALAVKDASARSVLPPTDKNIADRWAAACAYGFNPTKNESIDQEAKTNKAISDKARLGCSQKDEYVRLDRSMENLLGPLEYRAPKKMTALPINGAYYDRFSAYYDRSKGDFSANDLDKYTYPTVAAAMFCENIAENFLPSLSNSTDFGGVEIVRSHESWESKTMANCWRFFEERVAYPSGLSGEFDQRHQQQYARCLADFEANIISEQAKSDCNTNGRSTLKARADAAYRADSETYTKFLTKALRYEGQVQVLGVAAGDAERFQQTLAVERQIMTDTLGSVRMAPLSSTTPVQDSVTSAITGRLIGR